jgi:hypothetical protein
MVDANTDSPPAFASLIIAVLRSKRRKCTAESSSVSIEIFIATA